MIDVTVFYNGSIPDGLTKTQFLSDLEQFNIDISDLGSSPSTFPIFLDLDSVNPLPFQFSFFHVFDVVNEWNSFYLLS